MSVKQSFSSSSYSTSSSVASLSTNPMMSSPSLDSTSCQALLQSSRDIARKMAAARSANQESDSSERSFLSVRKNDSLMKSRANMIERSVTQGMKLRLLLSDNPKTTLYCSKICISLFIMFTRKNVIRDIKYSIFLEPYCGLMYFLVYILLDTRDDHSSKECCTAPPDIDVGNGNNPDFQGSAYSRSSSSFLIEDILFQRPKVKIENSC